MPVNKISDKIQRRVLLRMMPNATERAALDEIHGLHCRLTNTLIEEHQRRHEANQQALNFSAMCKEMTRWRANVAALAALNAQSMRVTARRVALAFDAFFRRVKNGQAPGYPRFKSRARFSGWGYKTAGDGWKLLQERSTHKPGKKYCGTSYGAVRLSGIGTIGLRGRARFAGTPKTAEVLRKAGKWYLSVTFDVDQAGIARQSGTQSMAFDWGLKTLLTQVTGNWDDGLVEPIENPRWLKSRLNKIREMAQGIALLEEKAQAASGQAQGFPVNARLRSLYQRLRTVHGQVARQRNDFYHKLTAKLVSRFGLIVTEELRVKDMSRAPQPKVDDEGHYVPNGAAQKAGLNRSIEDAAV
jgi:putative transposase